MMAARALLQPFSADKVNWAVLWLALFTLAAGGAHLYLSWGGQLLANPDQAYAGPFQNSLFLLGTDQLGRDVLSYLLLSCRTAWLLVFPPLIGATLLGVTTGTAAALVGNDKFKLRVSDLISFGLTLLLGLLFYPMFQWGTEKTLGNGAFSVLAYLCTFLVIGFVLLSQLLKNLLGGAKTFALPVDAALQKIIEVWSTFPKLLLLLLLTTFTPFSILTLMGWICATYWVLPARVARASVLQLKQEAFFEATTSLGLPFQRVLVNHLWPSLKGPVITNFCFAASGLMGIGSTLAYLGIGLPADVPSWGKMLASARLSLEAWWLFAFPALLLLITIFSLQAMGNKYSSSKTANSVTNHQ